MLGFVIFFWHSGIVTHAKNRGAAVERIRKNLMMMATQ